MFMMNRIVYRGIMFNLNGTPVYLTSPHSDYLHVQIHLKYHPAISRVQTMGLVGM